MSLVLEDHTCVYGDNDRLPSGNVIGCSWPAIIDASSTMQYDARIFEVVVTHSHVVTVLHS